MPKLVSRLFSFEGMNLVTSGIGSDLVNLNFLSKSGLRSLDDNTPDIKKTQRLFGSVWLIKAKVQTSWSAFTTSHVLGSILNPRTVLTIVTARAKFTD